MLDLQILIKRFITWSKSPDFELYNEAGLQHEILFFLRNEIGDNYKVYAERNISSLKKDISLEDFNKKEMDIYIQSKDSNEKYCIELKYLTGKAIPRRMSQIFEDIKFLQELKKELHFNECLFFLMTPQAAFHTGTKEKGLYATFRNEEILIKNLNRDDLQDFLKPNFERFNIEGDYKTEWLDYDPKHKYFFVKV